MTKRNVSTTKKTKPVKTTKKVNTSSETVQTETVQSEAEAEVQPLEKNKAKTAKKETEKKETKKPEKASKKEAEKAEEEPLTPEAVEEPASEKPKAEEYTTPRRSVAFIGSECYPFVKTGGLGDVMYALPKALIKQNCDVKVILPRYKCIPQEYQEKMVFKGSFQMDLCADGKSFYVGIMEYVWDGVVYDFIDNEEFFASGNPYTNLIDDIPKYCYFAKAALAALNYMDWVPDIIHCHDWQAALVPVFLQR